MEIAFKAIDLERDFETCVAFRRDTHFCGFQSYEGFGNVLDGYRERMAERMEKTEWFYLHVWVDGQIAGQLEFRSTYQEPNTGYVHLIYLRGEFRGTGLADVLHDYICSKLRDVACRRAVLSVSRTNHRAVNFYQSHGWEFLAPNPKHATTDFYQRNLLL